MSLIFILSLFILLPNFQFFTTLLQFQIGFRILSFLIQIFFFYKIDTKYKILWKRGGGKISMLLHNFHPIVQCSVVAFWRKTATTTHLMCCRRCEVFCGYFFEFNIQNLGKTNICTYSLFHQYLHTVWTAKRVALLWYNIYLVYKWSLKNWHKWSNLYR